jgi:hypothetical protein
MKALKNLIDLFMVITAITVILAYFVLTFSYGLSDMGKLLF